MLNFLKVKKERDKFNNDFKTDEEGNAFFNITIKDKSEVLSPYYYGDKEVINVEFAGMIDNIISSVPYKKKVHLSLTCNDIVEDDKKRYSKAIKNYYKNKMKDAQIRLKKNRNMMLFTIILSTILLVGLFLVNYFNSPWILIELAEIITWVFVWELVDIVAFQRTLIKYEHYRAKCLYECKITY